MTDKPTKASGYTSEQLSLVKSTCLYIATKLGDLMGQTVIVGGLVPPLLIPEEDLAHGVEPHVGTMDLDLGLSLALLEDKRYEEMTKRLRRAGFEPDINIEGNLTRQRWKIERPDGVKVTVDFLIAPINQTDRGGTIRSLERDFAALITKGLALAFRDKREVTLTGTTIFQERASRRIWICGPGAFVVLKALAFANRGDNKDAYDLYYVIRNYGQGIDDVYAGIAPLLQEKETREALTVLQRDFLNPDAIGPQRVAEFLGDIHDEGLKADVVGFVKELLSKCHVPPQRKS